MMARDPQLELPPAPSPLENRTRASSPRIAVDQNPLTDVGNARRLVAGYRDEIRWVPSWKCWLVWDGHRWCRDELNSVLERAKDTVREYTQAATDIADDDKRAKAVRFGLASERAQRLNAMVDLAKSDPEIAISADQLDRDPLLFNCLNGTIDLTTGDLLPHEPERLLTKIAPVEFDLNAVSETWDRFIDTVTGGDQELADYLQRTAGYALTGLTDEEIILFIVGPTGTGKTTYLEAIKAVMGDYAATANSESFLHQGNRSGPRNDLARLRGIRLVTASELPQHRTFDEVTLKQLSGGDTINARFLYSEEFEYRPQFLITIAANHRPSVREGDDAVWRRLKLVPFDQRIPANARDPEIKKALTTPATSGSAILNWMVKGALKWREHGLREPTTVTVATRSYRIENDHFSQFVDERCIEGDHEWISSDDLYKSYRAYSEAVGNHHPYGPRQVTTLLQDRGCTPERRSCHRGWRGIGLAERVSPDTSPTLDTDSGKSSEEVH